MKFTVMYGGLSVVTAALVAFVALDPSLAREARVAPHQRFSKVGDVGDESAEARIKVEQFAQARLAPGTVRPGAYSDAFASLSALPVYGRSTWTEVTNRPYDS